MSSDDESRKVDHGGGSDDSLKRRHENDGDSASGKRFRSETNHKLNELGNQVNNLTAMIHGYMKNQENVTPAAAWGENAWDSSSRASSPDDQRAPLQKLNVSQARTSIDEKRVVKQATTERVEALKFLQRLESPDWKEIRYSNTLREFIATPGFTNLEVNSELCYLDRKKDPFLPTERALAGLSNAVLEQRDLLSTYLQNIIDWASAEPAQLTVENLAAIFNQELLSAESPISGGFNQILQIICGKRAEVIESRRELLLSELKNNRSVQASLRKIPPSVSHLFNKEELAPLIQSLGGPQNWLSTPASLQRKPPASRPPASRPPAQQRPSLPQSYQTWRSGPNRNPVQNATRTTGNTKASYKKDSPKAEQGSFRKK